MKHLHIIILSVILLSFTSCSHEKVKSEAVQNSLKKKTESIKQKIVDVHYALDSIKNNGQLEHFNTQYSNGQRKIIAAINRLDVNKIRIGTILSIPDTIYSSFIEYSNFPATLTVADSIEKLILISLRTQLFAAYEFGKLVRSGPTSTGKKSTPTPSGLFYTNFKAKLKISTVDREWKMPWYFNISNRSGIGMHQYTLPGYPASHTCIRLYEEDAKWNFDWAKQWVLNKDETVIIQHGTPVIVFGKYNFDEPPPWKQLANNPKELVITAQEWTEINNHISEIKK